MEYEALINRILEAEQTRSGDYPGGPMKSRRIWRKA